MIAAERLLSRQDWHSWLSNFADLVSDKEFVKIKYSDWKTLVKPVSNMIAVELKMGAIGNPMISIAVGGSNPVVLFTNDGSLGGFLFDNMFSKEEKAILYNSNNSATAVSGKIAAYETNSYLDVTALESCSTAADKATYQSITIAGDPVCSNTIKIGDTLTTWDGSSWGTIGIADRTDCLEDKINQRPTFNDVEKMIDNRFEEKENEKMKGFNFDFGPCTNDQVRMSMYGMAVKNAAGTYVSYNPKSKEIVDVDVLNFDGAKFMYKIPVAVKDVAVGDIIIHNRKPMFVVALPTEGATAITCVDVCAGEQKLVIPTVNMFGFNFVTKIVSLFNTVGDNAPTPDAPFGNMLPFLMMGEGNDIDPMMLMCMMGGKMDMSNPMMMYFMLKDGKNTDILPLMLMMQNK